MTLALQIAAVWVACGACVVVALHVAKRHYENLPPPAPRPPLSHVRTVPPARIDYWDSPVDPESW